MAETDKRRGRPAGVDKAAILLLTLGPEAASAIFRHLSEGEVRQVSAAIARLRTIPREHTAAVHEEAWRRLTGEDGMLVDGAEFARQMIGATLGGGHGVEERRELERVTQSGASFLASGLEPITPGVLAGVLAGEHPQAIALVLANLPARKAADVLAALPEGLRPDIVRRIADLQGVSDDLLVDVSDVLHGQVEGLGRPAPAPGVSGVRVAAQILNLVDKAVGERVFVSLDEHAPETSEAVRRLMLTFEDLTRLDDRGMQLLLKEVPREELIVALKTASPAMRNRVFANLSARAAEILKDDMATMGPVRLKDVEKAQASVVAVARRLESEQRITLGGGDDVVL